jgi:subtilase family serine protease
MRRIGCIAASAVALAVAALPVSATPAHAAGTAPAWVGTATRAYPSRDAKRLGALAPSTPMHLVVALQLRHRDALQSEIAAGHVLTTKQFVARYAPTAAQARAVQSYLARRGMHSGVASNRLLLTVTGTAAQASSAFGTHLDRFRQRGRVVFANTTGARVPASLGGIVASVVGLNRASRMHTHLRFAKSAPSSCAIAGVGYPCTYNPAGFWRAYDATKAAAGAHTAVAIFAEGALAGVVKDLRTEERANGLAQVPVTIVHTGKATADTSGVDEWDMDTQYSTGMARSVRRLYLYDASSLDDADITVAFNKFAAQNAARAASASFGECEFAASLGGSMAADDNALMEAAAQGQTVFTSSGDSGGFCPVAVGVNGVPAGVPDAEFPASSPYVISVGGTTLQTSADGSYAHEIAWVAGGGGPSAFEAPRGYQQGVAPGANVCATAGVRCGRGVPDIAMDADPNSGANVYVGGQPEGVGGTSLSSPLALGVWARLQSAHGNKLGFAGKRLYAARGTNAFHDIVLGDTGPYPALPGYDYATGIGTFDVAKAIARIK